MFLVWTGFTVTFSEWWKQTELGGERHTICSPLPPLVGWIALRPNPPTPALRIVCAGGGGRKRLRKENGWKDSFLPHINALVITCVYAHVHTRQKGASGRLLTHPLLITFPSLASSFLPQARDMSWGLCTRTISGTRHTYGKHIHAALDEDSPKDLMWFTLWYLIAWLWYGNCRFENVCFGIYLFLLLFNHQTNKCSKGNSVNLSNQDQNNLSAVVVSKTIWCSSATHVRYFGGTCCC